MALRYLDKILALKTSLEANKNISIIESVIPEPLGAERLAGQLEMNDEIYISRHPDGTKMNADLKSFYSEIGDISLIYRGADPEDESSSGGFRLYSHLTVLANFMSDFWKDKLWFDDTEEPYKSEMQSLLPFDYFNGFDGQFACLRMEGNEIKNEVYLHDNHGVTKIVQFPGTISDYFDIMIAAKGMHFWQYEFLYPGSDRYGNFVERYAAAFPGEDIVSVFATFREKLGDAV